MGTCSVGCREHFMQVNYFVLVSVFVYVCVCGFACLRSKAVYTKHVLFLNVHIFEKSTNPDMDGTLGKNARVSIVEPKQFYAYSHSLVSFYFWFSHSGHSQNEICRINSSGSINVRDKSILRSPHKNKFVRKENIDAYFSPKWTSA